MNLWFLAAFWPMKFILMVASIQMLLFGQLNVTADPEQQQQLTFGLTESNTSTMVKRAANSPIPGRQYNFGIGKKSIDTLTDVLPEQEFSDNYIQESDISDIDNVDNDQYSSVSIPKRADSGNSRFNFGLGKRQQADRFAFGLGKRTTVRLPILNQDRLAYSFGLGKRSQFERRLEDYMKRRFAFGIGKRSPQFQRYSFGLGK